MEEQDLVSTAGATRKVDPGSVKLLAPRPTAATLTLPFDLVDIGIQRLLS